MTDTSKPARSRVRGNPFPTASSLTLFALLFLIAGLLGYNVSRHARYVEGTAWRGSVIWWEVATGVALIPLAVYYWRRALRSM